MFEAVRQIVEARLFGVSVAQQTFTTGTDSGIPGTGTATFDNIRTVSTFSGLSTSTLASLNPTYLDFPTNALITVTGNSEGASNDEIKTTGWVGGDLVPNNTVLTSLVFTNSFGDAAGIRTFNEFLIITTSSETLSIEDKILEWVSVINTQTLAGVVDGFGITAIADGTSMLLVPKDRAADNIQDQSLTIDTSGAGTFVASLDFVNIPGEVYLLFKDPVSFEVFLEGRVVQPAATSENWAVLLISDSTVVGREFGNTSKGLRSSGSIRFKLYAPRNAGTKLIREMADELDLTYSYTTGDSDTNNGGTLFIKAGSLSKVSDDEDGKLSYNLDYIYDYYTS